MITSTYSYAKITRRIKSARHLNIFAYSQNKLNESNLAYLRYFAKFSVRGRWERIFKKSSQATVPLMCVLCSR
jgi:hypothetical protein